MFRSLTPSLVHMLIPAKACAHKYRQRLTRGVALTIAVLLALFLFQIASHVHPNDQNETACNRCQLAHLGLALVRSNTVLPAPLLAVGRTLPVVLIFHLVLFLQFSSCRAPPSA
jgi:hypothetical protein